jgi:hypothetical protein
MLWQESARELAGALQPQMAQEERWALRMKRLAELLRRGWKRRSELRKMLELLTVERQAHW